MIEIKLKSILKITCSVYVNKLEVRPTRGSVGYAWSPTCYFALRKLYTEHSIGAFYQNSINLAKWFYRKFFQLANNKQELLCGHIGCTIGTKYGNFVQDLQYIIQTK